MPISAKVGGGGENSRGGGEHREIFGNSIRWEDSTQGLPIKRRFVLSYIYTLCSLGAARTSIICRRVLEKTVSPPNAKLLSSYAKTAPVMQERGAHAIKLLE